MSRQLGCVVVVFAAFIGIGAFLVWVVGHRATSDRLACQNQLRVLSQFAESAAALNMEAPLFASEKPRAEKADRPRPPRNDLGPTIPPGTVVNPLLPPEQRLSWVVHLMPILAERSKELNDLAPRIDPNKPWDAEVHQPIAPLVIPGLLCPGNLPKVSGPAVTQFVGIGGLGADAATLPVPADGETSSRAGCFRYDAPTPFSAITDGLSQTVLFGEVSADLGPWLRGGPATIRCLDTTPAARAIIGPTAQFGGNHEGGANFAFADHSVRFLTLRTDPQVLRNLFTIAGGTPETLPGE